MERERGHPLCRNGRDISKGGTVTGEPHAVSVPLTCPPGTTVAGVHHSHPGGSIRPSSQDIATMRRHGLGYLCVEARGKIKCYRPRGRRK